ncbi:MULTISPECIES: glycosyltransferase family 2 protein [Paenibacillus]|uniref:tetratricopeptide repeat-containing glycosyltransferase family 2 protein n=1 Tax=Paenibacillus TaxID=44249 RepID=UPI001F27CE55|nr:MULTISPECIES: glycosyltransferase family 2 protein [Paenibacillus]
MKKPSISLCMIVKDEASSLDRCLKSAVRYVDEIIIVDTGSTDGTPDIARTFTPSVIPFPWNESFSDARNFGLSQANGDWIMWLDADEIMECDDDPRLLRELSDSKELLLSVRTVQYMGMEPDLNQAFQMAQTRLFRNHAGFRFLYSIHEMLNAEAVLSRTARHAPIPLVPITVHHYGYMDQEAARKHTVERNLRMLEQADASSEKHPWLEYHLAGEYYRGKQYEKAYEFVNQSILRFIESGQIPPSMLYQLKYACALASGNEQSVCNSINKAIQLYPDYVDLHYYKGVILFKAGCFEEALATFEHCLSLGDNRIRHLTEYGVGGDKAASYIKLCQERIGSD